MKKSLLIILPIATLALAGCRGGRGGSSNSGAGSSGGASSGQSQASSGGQGQSSGGGQSQTSVRTDWPAQPEGDGSLENPWNVSQAWTWIDSNLERTKETKNQEPYTSDQEYSVRGYICYLETISDGRDPAHPNSIKFHLADNNHYVTEDIVLGGEDYEDELRNGLCVYFADTDPAIASSEAAEAMEGKLVTVTGKLFNWYYEPEVWKNAVISNVTDA